MTQLHLYSRSRLGSVDTNDVVPFEMEIARLVDLNMSDSCWGDTDPFIMRILVIRR